MNDADPFKHKDNAKKLFTKEEIGTYWNDLYKDVHNCRDYHFVQRLEVTTHIFEQSFPLNSKILDLGCGAGVLTENLVQLGYSVDAADMSPDMLGYTKERLSKYSSDKYRVFQAECENIESPDDFYDVVACIGVFGYMDDVDAAIKEIRRVLKPGGTLIMSVRNFNNLKVFDLFNWVNMLFYKGPKKIVNLVLKKKEPQLDNTGESSAKVASGNFIEIFDRPSNVKRIFASQKFELSDFYGTGYGPIIFKGKSLVSESIAKRMSGAFRWFFRLIRVETHTKWFADISIYVFKK